MCRKNKLKNARGEFKTDQTVVDNISTLFKTAIQMLKLDPLSEMCHITCNQAIANNSIDLILDRLEGIESKLSEGVCVHDTNTIRPTWVPDANDFPPLSLLPSVLAPTNAPTRSRAASKKARQRRNRSRKLTLFPPNDSEAHQVDKSEADLLAQVNEALVKRLVFREPIRDNTPEEQENSIVTASAVDKLPGGEVDSMVQ
ncbi:hypothetical protein BT69DRAFT_1336564 [Atractiella rhizophila]|nr:hypothetical protein BT69DRAFT_1336564 [Atractiella rhizophila]